MCPLSSAEAPRDSRSTAIDNDKQQHERLTRYSGKPSPATQSATCSTVQSAHPAILLGNEGHVAWIDGLRNTDAMENIMGPWNNFPKNLANFHFSSSTAVCAQLPRLPARLNPLRYVSHTIEPAPSSVYSCGSQEGHHGRQKVC